MDSAQRRLEVPHHVVKRGGERRTPSDQHIVVAVAQPSAAVDAIRAGGRQSHQFAQPAAHAIALHRIADLPRHRKADPDRFILTAPPCLHNERICCGAQAGGCRPKITAALQPLHGIGEAGAALRH